ncbi:MAG: aspartate aminotransferase family protein [Defluviitaleaceae bacterium]|nr:aspartate aminotransferase family protein [Defluviitaleaceae bacterium]
MLNPNINIVSSENCYIIDENGKKYVDFEAGVWSASLGHNNKEINAAMIRQMNEISHVGYRYTTKIVDKAAGKVLDLLGFDGGKCVFLSSGSEAVEFGVKIAKKVIDKPYFLYLNNYYLSAYGISANRSKEDWIPLDLSEYKGNAEDFLAHIPFDKIAAFVFEPGNASGTAQLPPKELIKAIEDKIKACGGVIVVDEVTTGIGRTGKWFGYEHYNMSPDIVCLGKGIGGGYPVSVIGMVKDIADLVEKSDFVYAQSHQDDPLGCAVVYEVISIIERDKLIQKAADMGKILERELKSLMARHNIIKEVRGVGLMYVIELNQREDITLDEIHKAIFDAGYIAGLRPQANVLRFYPPLTIEEGQIKGLVRALDNVLCVDNIS